MAPLTAPGLPLAAAGWRWRSSAHPGLPEARARALHAGGLAGTATLRPRLLLCTRLSPRPVWAVLHSGLPVVLLRGAQHLPRPAARRSRRSPERPGKDGSAGRGHGPGLTRPLCDRWSHVFEETSGHKMRQVGGDAPSSLRRRAKVDLVLGGQQGGARLSATTRCRPAHRCRSGRGAPLGKAVSVALGGRRGNDHRPAGPPRQRSARLPQRVQVEQCWANRGEVDPRR